MTTLILWQVVLAIAVTWGALGWRAARRLESLYDHSLLTRREEQREHWRALGATYGTVQAAKAQLQGAEEQIAELEVVRRLLFRHHEALTSYMEFVDTSDDTHPTRLLLNESRALLETVGLLKPERREVVS